MGYSLFTYSCFAYFRPKSCVSPTLKKVMCNVLNINVLLNIHYNNNTTIIQYILLQCNFIYIKRFIMFMHLSISANSRLFEEDVLQLPAVCSCCLLFPDHFYKFIHLDNRHFRQLCHPSRWLLVLKRSLQYTFRMIKGNLPTNH